MKEDTGVCAQETSEETGSGSVLRPRGLGPQSESPAHTHGAGPPGVHQAIHAWESPGPGSPPCLAPSEGAGVCPVVPGGPPPHTRGLGLPGFLRPLLRGLRTGPAGTGGAGPGATGWPSQPSWPSAASTASPAPGTVLLQPLQTRVLSQCCSELCVRTHMCMCVYTCDCVCARLCVSMFLYMSLCACMCACVERGPLEASSSGCGSWPSVSLVM